MLLSFVVTAATAAPRGVALVIGNSNYQEQPLVNPVNDAQDMAAVLKEAGFDVTLRRDLSESAMKEALADFEDRLRVASGGVGVFYFAGHGVQTARGRNYLLPVGRRYVRERDVELFGVSADAVLSAMEKAGRALNVIILDACRDAPLPAEGRSAVGRGLARMDAPSGSIIAFATTSGKVASDGGSGRNGLYTGHLLKAMRQPGLRLEDVFKEVGKRVEHDSNFAQSPEEFMKLRDSTPFCFFPGRGCGVTPVRIQSVEEVEQELWSAIASSADPVDFREYLRRYPNGRFAALADRRLRQLAVVAVAPASLPAPPSIGQARAAPVAPAERAAVAPATQARMQPGKLGTLVMRDKMTGHEESIDVVPVGDGPDHVFSSGDIVGKDGIVKAVRVGRYVGTVERGELWKLPIDAEASGRARMAFAGVNGTGEFKWHVSHAEGDLREVKVYVELPGGGWDGQITRKGTWIARYRGDVLLPLEAQINTGLSNSTGNRQPEMVDARLTLSKPRP